MRVNSEIISQQVKLVDNGDNKGVQLISRAEALQLAEKQGLDLVALNDDEIPVVKIVDYNKFMYEKHKKEKENKKKAKLNSQELKEIRITESIADNDLKTKAKNIDRILKDGDKVKMSIRYRGRSIKNISGGTEKLKKLLSLVTFSYKIDKDIKTEGNTVSMIIAPLK